MSALLPTAKLNRKTLRIKMRDGLNWWGFGLLLLPLGLAFLANLLPKALSAEGGQALLQFLALLCWATTASLGSVAYLLGRNQPVEPTFCKSQVACGPDQGCHGDLP